MKKIIALLLCILAFCSVITPVCLAAEDEEIRITLDVNERYTNISEIDDDDPYLGKSEETLQKDKNKKVYIAVLVILLVISLGILVYTLRKVPSEKGIEEKDTKKLLSDNTEEKEE